MNQKQARRLRKLVYKTDESNRYRSYFRSPPKIITDANGLEKKILGQINADIARKVYQKIKTFYKSGSSIPQLTNLVGELM